MNESRYARFFILSGVLPALLLAGLLAGEAGAVRIKDIAALEGTQQLELVGYGLVVGLKGTGDRTSSVFTKKSISNMLLRMGISVSPDELKVRNVAAVTVTARLTQFQKVGSRIDLTVSSLGDARSLEGGTLLRTELLGPDGRVYVVGQGPLSVGGYAVEAIGGSRAQRNYVTVARISGGGLVTNQVSGQGVSNGKLRLTLREPDFTSASRVEDAINGALGANTARALDAGTIEVTLPDTASGVSQVQFLSQLESLQVNPDVVARVVINERTGTVVAGGNVQIGEVAISQGALSVEIRTVYGVSQPAPFSTQGETVVVPESEIQISQDGKGVYAIKGAATVEEIAQALNAIGVRPRDLIALFEAMKKAGALHAEILII